MDVDSGNMKLILERFPEQIEAALDLGKSIKVKGSIKQVIIAGLGGSAAAAEILKVYLSREKLQITIHRDYLLPEFADEATLVFASSYSGDSEETLSCYRSAMRKGCKIIGISSGGKLQEYCKRDKVPFVLLPSGLPQRLGTGYMFFPILTILQDSGIIKDRSKDIRQMLAYLKENDFQEPAKKIVQNIGKKVPIIYSSLRFWPIAMKWKIDINENAKIAAFYNIYPEFNHNELNAYTNKTIDAHILILKDDEEIDRIDRRMRVTSGIFKKRGFTVTEVSINGNNYLTKLFSGVMLGLWVSYYLALALGIDPTPVPIIKELKDALR
jgi:glucose/mannose-6-phosphate isomerase